MAKRRDDGKGGLMQSALFLLLGGVAMLGSSCFTSIASMNFGNGPEPPAEMAKAEAMDVVTFPIQAPFLLVAGVGELAREHAEKEMKIDRDASFVAIKKDPTIFKKWDLESTEKTPEQMAILMALDNPVPLFTDDQLREIIRRTPQFRMAIYASPAISEAFLRTAFEDELRKDIQGQPSALEGMLENPHMPDDLVLQIVQRTPKNNRIVFIRRGAAQWVASEAILRAAFPDELRKADAGQPNVLQNIIARSNFPEDLKFEIIRRSPKNIPNLYWRG